MRTLAILVCAVSLISAQSLTVTGSPSLGSIMTLTLTGPPGSLFALAMSPDPGPTNLPPFGSFDIGVPIYLVVGQVVNSPIQPVIGPGGYVDVHLGIPVLPPLIGQEFYFQALYYDPFAPFLFSKSNGVNFTVLDPVLAPTITSISPTQGPSSGGTPVTITGTNFEVGGTTVTLDGQPLQSMVVVDVMTITGDTPPGTPGITADLEVTTTNGGTAILASAFLYIPDPPVITDITPDHSQVGGGAIITITGTALGPGTDIFIAGIQLSPLIQTDTQVVASAPNYNQLGFVDVVASSSGGVLVMPSSFRFTILLDTGTGADGPFTPTANTTLDTTANMGVFNFTEVNVPAGVQVTVSGPNPLHIRCIGDVSIAGDIIADGQDGSVPAGGLGGPGGGHGGDGGWSSNGDGQPGGGLGGGPGSSGQSGCTGSFGTQGSNCPGPTYGSLDLVPLFAGSGGSGSSGLKIWCPGPQCQHFHGGGGGGGGGGVGISAGGSVAVTGNILCRGGGAGSVATPANSTAHGGSGSGGAVRLATQGHVILNGLLSVEGGTTFHVLSGSPLNSGGNGRWYIENWLGQTFHGVTAQIPTGIY